MLTCTLNPCMGKSMTVTWEEHTVGRPPDYPSVINYSSSEATVAVHAFCCKGRKAESKQDQSTCISSCTCRAVEKHASHLGGAHCGQAPRLPLSEQFKLSCFSEHRVAC